MRLIVGKGFFHVSNVIIDKWSLTGLNAVALRVFLTLLRHAYGEGSEVWPSRSIIARKCSISSHYVSEIINAMHDLGILATTLVPGRPSTVDLRPAERYFSDLKQPVDNLPGLSTTRDRAVTTTHELAVTGQDDEKRTKSKENRLSVLRRSAGNNTRTRNTSSCRNKARRPEPSRKSSDTFAVPPSLFSPSNDSGNGAEKGRAAQPSESVLLELASVEQIPEKALLLRKPYLSDDTPGTARQRIETLIRHELRSVLHIRTSVINRWFCEVPADGILHWMNEAYVNGRRPAAWLVSVIDRTRGEYPGRKGAAA